MTIILFLITVYFIVCKVVEESKEMNELLEIQNTYPGLYEGSFLDRGITYLSVEIEVNSGDKMLIICESIEI